MTIYTCITQEGTLSAEQRARFAQEIIRGHIELSGDNDPARSITGDRPDRACRQYVCRRQACRKHHRRYRSGGPQFGIQSQVAEESVVHVQERHWSVG